MKQMNRLLALFLALVLTVNLLPIGIFAVNSQTPDTDLIVDESFEVGESFEVISGQETVTMNKAHYVGENDYDSLIKYEAVWNGAKPTGTSYLEAFWNSTAHYSNDYTIPAAILSGGIADVDNAGEECVSLATTGKNGKVYINYKLYENEAAMARMEDGATYIASIMFKSSGTNATSGGGKMTLAAVLNNDGSDASTKFGTAIVTSPAITRNTVWTKLEIEFTYDEDYKDALMLQINTGNGNGGSISFDKLTLQKKDTYVSLQEHANVEVGNTIALSATVYPTGSAITWSSSDPTVASVDPATGVVTGVAAGTAEITATVTSSWGSDSATCNVTVSSTSAPQEVLVFEENFEVGESFETISGQETVTMNKAYYVGENDYDPLEMYEAVWNGAKPTGTSYLEAFWNTNANYSNDYTIPAAILSGGVADVDNAGEECVTVTYPGRNGRVYINYKLYENADAMAKMEHGATYVASIMYKSSGTSSGTGGGKMRLNVVLNSDGTDAATKYGTIIVQSPQIDRKTAWTKLELEFTYDEAYSNALMLQIDSGNANGGTITIDKLMLERKIPTVEEVILNHTDTFIETGKTLDLACELKPAGVQSDLTFKTSDTSVATVDANGKITAVAPGKAEITVTALNGEISAKCTVHVVDTYVELTGITLDKETLNVNPGYCSQLVVSKIPANASEYRVSWTSSDNNVVSIDANGNLVARATGSAVITVTVGSLTKTCTVTVTDADGFVSTSQNADVTFGGTKEIDLSTILPGSKYVVISAPASGMVSMSGNKLSYTASVTLLEDQKGEYIDKTYADQVIISVEENGKNALITLNVTIGKLEDLFYNDNDQWITDVTMMMTEDQLAAIKQQFADTNSLHYKLLMDLCNQADSLVSVAPVEYVKPAETATTSYDTNQTSTGDNTMTFLMAYLFTKDVPGFEAKNAVYLQETIDWVTASLQYPFWGTRGYQNQDLASAHQLFSVSMVYHWMQEELKDLRVDHTMGTDGSTEEKWNETVKTENLPMLEAIEKRLWQAASDMYSRNLTGVTYTNNHLNIRMGGLLAAATVLRQQENLTDEQKQTLVKWTGEAIFKQGVSMDALQIDGTSHEGINYWAYGGKFIIRANILAEQNFGFNMMKYYQLYKDSPAYVLHHTLSQDHWFSNGKVNVQLNLGDAYTDHHHSVSELLRYLAALYGDSTAQWLAGEFEDANMAPSNGSLWLGLIVVDPDIQAVQPTTEATTKWFEELGIVISRSDWSGDESIVAIKTGTPAGVTLTQQAQSGEYPGVVDAGHSHPDQNHILIYANGEFLLRDDGVVDKYTSNHNTLLINGKGQVGDEQAYIDEQIYIRDNLIPSIEKVETGSSYDYIVGDATQAYAKEKGLDLFERNMVYLKEENVVLVVDNVQTSKEADLELRWFPSSKTVIELSDYYRVISASNNMNFYPFTDATTTSFEYVTAYGRGATTNEKTFRQTFTGTNWQNAVAFSWNDAGSSAAAVQYEAGANPGEHKFCVNGKIYTINVNTCTVSVTDGDLTSGDDTSANDSTLVGILLNNAVYEDFDPDVKEFTVNRWWNDSEVPEIIAIPNANEATVSVEWSNDTVTITCESKDGTSKTVYILHVTNYGKLTVMGAETDHPREGYDLASTYDGVLTWNNTKPYWTVNAPASGKVNVIYDFGKLVKITQIDLAIQNSKSRTSYYDLQISTDGENWTVVQEDYEVAPTADISANNHAFRTILEDGEIVGRYLKLVLRGNSTHGKDTEGAACGINEVTFIGCEVYDVALEGTDAEYTITGEKDNYEPGDEITVTAKIPEGKRFVRWNAEGIELEDPTSETITIKVNSNIKLTAVLMDIDDSSSATGDFSPIHLVIFAGMFSILSLAALLFTNTRKK